MAWGLERGSDEDNFLNYAHVCFHLKSGVGVVNCKYPLLMCFEKDSLNQIPEGRWENIIAT